MKIPALRISGTGCCLMDYLYTSVDFTDPVFINAQSRAPGDGGLHPGSLVFSEDFENFVSLPFAQWLEMLTGGSIPDAQNLGGPAIVSLIHTAQMLFGHHVEVSFHAGSGDDEIGRQIRHIIRQTPVDIREYHELAGVSPTTVVLSDPSYHGGNGERTFINTIGAAGDYRPDMLSNQFFGADIRLFAATALLPNVHDNLTDLLRRGRQCGGVNVVGTVYDFRNEQRHPHEPWPLGDGVKSYPYIDLLVCDFEEALKISGCRDTDSSIEYFLKKGVGSVVVTQGADCISIASQGGVFSPQELKRLPVCAAVGRDLKAGVRTSGDTTGCGDNFLGGVLASLAIQMVSGCRDNMDLQDASAWGVASGGYACFLSGGTMIEPEPGFKYREIESYYRAYLLELQELKNG